MTVSPWRPDPDEAALAAALGPGGAWVRVDGAWLAVRGIAGPGHRPSLALAQAIWEHLPGRAHAALRSRLRVVGEPDGFDRAVAAVVGKRVVGVAPGAGAAPPWVDLGAAWQRAQWRVAAAARPGEGRVPDAVAAWLRAQIPAAAPGRWVDRDRPVVAVLADAEGRVLRSAVNVGGANRTLHAELCLVQAHGALPAGATVYTSLQPCRLCAAALVDAATGALAVRYLVPDPGRLATRTALQDRGWEQPVAADLAGARLDVDGG